MDVSIVIVNWNTADYLRNCIKSIREQSDGIDYEVIVVDNASSDNSVSMVEEFFPWAKLIKNSQNGGYAKAVNDGIKVARGKYVLVLNSDIIIVDSAIDRTFQYAENHPEAAVVGCQVRENDVVVQMTCFRFPDLLNLFLRTFGLGRYFRNNRFFGRECMFWWLRDSEREVDVVSGMFMLVRRDAIDEVGLMDEDYFLYCEETDWCYRFAKAGWKRLFWPGATIIHIDGGSQSSKQVAIKMFVQKQKSLLIFFKKHSGVLNYFLGNLLLAVSNIFRVFINVILSIFKKVMRKRIDKESAVVQKRWAAFKFCVFGVEP